MPLLQDSALHLSDVRKKRLEVFFYFIYLFCLSLIMGLVLQVHKAFLRVKSRLPKCLFIVLTIWRTHPLSFFFLFFSWTLGSHGPGHTQKTSPLECKPTLVLLGKSMLQWSCSATFFFSLAALLQITGVSCKCHLYKRTWCFMGESKLYTPLFFFFFFSAVAGMLSLLFFCLNHLIYFVQDIEVGTAWAKHQLLPLRSSKLELPPSCWL